MSNKLRRTIEAYGDALVLAATTGTTREREHCRCAASDMMDQVLAMFDALRERIAAANQVLSEAGCDCDCDHPRCECDEECESNRCLGCRVEKALGGAQ